MAKEIRQGLFITFEGPEGSGKSTHSKLIVTALAKDGYDVVHTFEPGDTPLGKKIRDILLEKEDIRLGKISELFLFEADRAQHVEAVIVPALKNRKIVICDRFNTATFAYQGYGLGLGMDVVKPLDDIATKGVEPDLIILMDTDVSAGLKRASSANGADRMEKRSYDFHDTVRKGYLEIAAKDPAKVKVVTLKETIDQTYEDIREIIYDFIEQHTGAG